MPKPTNKGRTTVVICFLVVATLAAYSPIINNQFINYDDGQYITDNQMVKQGLTAQGIVWALTTGHGANWHPLTWISHMLDYQVFGLEAWGHHLTSVLFHTVNSVLLFLVLKRMTKSLWQSAFIAGLFALHPLHVESVTWAAERKDVLSTLFWMLTMIAYVSYVERPGFRRYLFVVLALAFGLMSKPMLVTLPFVLLLLDYWPLGRFELQKFAQTSDEIRPRGSSTTSRIKSAAFLLREKVPLFALVIVSSAITFIAQGQGGAVQTVESFSLISRVSNALVAYLKYLGSMIWPSGLTIYYPYPLNPLPVWQPVASGAVLLVISALVFRELKRRPYLAVGWLWYLGTLVPVIGIVQVGLQAMADRYTYVPLIGIFIVIAWGVPDLLARWSHRAKVLGVSAASVMIILMASTWVQVGYWRDSISLWGHAVSVDSDNWWAQENLGNLLNAQGLYSKAIEHYRESLRVRPTNEDVHYFLGISLANQGKTAEAIEQYHEALRLRPGYVGALNNLGVALGRESRYEEAIANLSEALRIQPDYADAHGNLGIALAMKGRNREAISHFLSAVQLDPGNWNAHYNLGLALVREGRIDEAITQYSDALRIKPDYGEAEQALERARQLQRESSSKSLEQKS